MASDASSGSLPPGPLAGRKVLDLTDLAGALCARLLGDLGADVVRVEPPGGAAIRRIAPFAAGAAPGEGSRADWFYNSNKRGVVLDPALADDRAELLRLLSAADVVVEARPPDLLGAAGIDPAQENPELVRVIVSPFGQSGPRAAWRGSDLICAAAGGMTFVNGHAAGAPIAPFGLQAYNSAGVFGAIGALCALRARELGAGGGTVDVAIAAAAAGAVEHVTGFYRQAGVVESRRGTLHWSRTFRIAPCKDGYVLLSIIGDWTTLVEWIASHGGPDAALLRDPILEDVNERKRRCAEIFDCIDRWAAERTQAELMDDAQVRRLPFGAVRLPAALGCDPQLGERGFRLPIQADAVRPGATLPGAPFVLSRTPWRLRRRSPRLGEHGAEVRAEPAWHAAAVSAARPRRTAARHSGRILDGIRVLDFTWVVAGPVTTRILADQGAEVIKLERKGAADFGSRRDGLSGNLNRGKQSIVLDLADPRGLDLARRLAAQSDLVIDNFSARVMQNFGLDYEGLRELRPDVVALSMSGFGKTGPARDFVSYGPTLQALVGFPFLMRLPGEAPAGWGYSWSDMAAGMMGALAALAALRHRDRTGEGQMIDLAQFETLVALLGPEVLAMLAGESVAPPGNRSQEGAAVPHGLYRCAAETRADGTPDDERWLAVAILDDGDWARLAQVLVGDGEAWASDPALAELTGRAQQIERVEAALARWTRRQRATPLQDRLQSAGIAAAVVANAEDLCTRDPQLAARGYLASVRTPEGGVAAFDGVPFVSSVLPGGVAAPGPLLGEHTDRVLREILGLPAGEIDELRRQGVVA